MICKHCGNQASENAAYCDRCGKKLSNKSNNTAVIILSIALAVTVLALVRVLISGRPGPQIYVDPTPGISSETEKESETPKHIHVWKAATCTAPESCTGCGDTRGQALGHRWQEATYDSPKTCYSCGATEGSSLHPLDGQSFGIGDIVRFGEYGYEEIEWKVIDKSGDKRLLISEYGLDCVEYDNQNSNNYSPQAVSWEDCSLRRWLNHNFYKEAFTDQEAEVILSVSDDGISDKVFILSYSQLEEYFPAQRSRICEPTAYSIENGSYNNYGGWWWLRTNKSATHISSVNADGAIDFNTRVNGQKATVRVCIWVEVP